MSGNNNDNNDNNDDSDNDNLPFESTLTEQESVDNINTNAINNNGRKTKYAAATILASYQQSKPSGNLLKYLGRSIHIYVLIYFQLRHRQPMCYQLLSHYAPPIKPTVT